MATIKSYTDLEQSRKLAEILPLESADLSYMSFDGHITLCPYIKMINEGFFKDEVIPCWSLASLLGVLPNGIVMNKDSQNGRYHFSSKYIGTSVTADNPVDACVDMIIRLNELNLL